MAEPALSEGPMTSVCVFCAANAQIDPVHIKTAFELGAAIAARGWTLVLVVGRCLQWVLLQMVLDLKVAKQLE